MNRVHLEELIIKHEGMILRPYIDTVGKTTIGCGRNLTDCGISAEEALYLLKNDLDRCEIEAHKNFIWFPLLSEKRKIVVISLIFNMGLSKFKGFKKTIAAMESKNYLLASKELLNSRWATQVGKRAAELSEMLVDSIG